MRKATFIAQTLVDLRAPEMWDLISINLNSGNCLQSEYQLTVGNDLQGPGTGKTITLSADKFSQAIGLFPESRTLLFSEKARPQNLEKQRVSWTSEIGSLVIAGNKENTMFARALFNSLGKRKLLVNGLYRNPEYSKEFLSNVTGRQDAPLSVCPGIHNVRDGYLEGVSAEMWFGEAFWQYASCTQDDILSADWLEVEERTNHLYVKAWPEPFNTAEGEQGEVQRRLLKLLFDIG